MRRVSAALCLLVMFSVCRADVLITNVQVWDGVSESLTGTTNVLVSENKITEIGADVTEGSEVIDGGGRVLMPGLIDSHVHMNHTLITGGGVPKLESMTWEEIAAGAAAIARELLMNGFTTVRDMGGMGTGIKRRIDEGVLVGPRIYAAGAYITQTSGHGDTRLRSQQHPRWAGREMSNLERLNITRIADGVPDMLAAVRENFAEGAAYIKIHAGGGVSSERDPFHTLQYTPEELAAADQAVRNWDTYWTVHAYEPKSINQALDAGARCIDHAQHIDERTMRRIVKEGIFLSSNLTAIHEDLFRHPLYGNPNTPVYAKARAYVDGAQNFVALVNKHRPRYVFNSDIVFSSLTYYRQHIDREKFVAADWFGNHYALLGLTSRGGELAAMTGKHNPYPGKLGVIEEGALADLLIVDGNPLEDIGAIGGDAAWFAAEPRGEDVKNLRLIMKDGQVYKNTL